MYVYIYEDKFSPISVACFEAISGFSRIFNFTILCPPPSLPSPVSPISPPSKPHQ